MNKVAPLRDVLSFSFISDTNACSYHIILHESPSVHNNLTGTLPDELGVFPLLNGLVLGWNSLVGSIPASIFNTNFQYLSLPFNNITGTIPTEIGKFGMLAQVWFQESSLTGNIPSEMGRNTGLASSHFVLRLAQWNDTRNSPESLGNTSNRFILQQAERYPLSRFSDSLAKNATSVIQ